MMEKFGDLAFLPLEFTKTGAIFKQDQLKAIQTALEDDGPDSVLNAFVVSHGWNNDMADALRLYQELFTNVSAAVSDDSAAKRSLVIGILWPSKKFTEAELVPGRDAAADGHGGTAEFDENASDISPAILRAKLEGLKTHKVFDGPDAKLDEAIALVDGLSDSAAARTKFVAALRGLVPAESSSHSEDASDRFLHMDGDELMALLKDGMSDSTPGSTGGLADFDDAVAVVENDAPPQDLFSGMRAAAWRLLNYVTYYQMKERAGIVGAGVNNVAASWRALRPHLRIHLIGHSFGARVVTAAAGGAEAFSPSSLTLLQGAFSHNGFSAAGDELPVGAFRNVVEDKRIAGPIVITHTKNDRAVGVAYPIASRIRQDATSAFGDETDPYGGMGRNGAVRLAASEFEAGAKPDAKHPWKFPGAKVHNVLADTFISSHGDVTNPTVAAILAAVAGI